MQYDALVLGGGPAGANFAQHAAKKGFSIVLVDWKPLGRYKCCAGGISFRVLRFYRVPDSIIECKIDGMTYVSPQMEQMQIGYDRVVGATVYRTEFDKWLLKRAHDAGSNLILGKKATNIRFSEKGVEAKVDDKTYRFKLLVGASGCNPSLFNYLGIQRPEMVMGLQMEFSMKTATVGEIIGNRCEFYYDPEYIQRGYLWIFPKREGVSVGIGGTYARREALIRFVRNHPVAAKKLRKARLRCFDKKSFHAALIPNGPVGYTYGDRYLLIGDAAGFTNPINWEGIYYALRSGDLAAETLEKAYDKSDFSHKVLSDYQRKWKKLFNRTFKRGKMIQRLLYSRNMSRLRPLVTSGIKRNRKMKNYLKNWIKGRVVFIER